MTPVWKRRQRRAYEMMWRDAERKRRRERFIAGPFGWIVETPSILTSWPFVIALIVLLSLFWVVQLLAHDAAEWIQRGGYKNAAGELCCGNRDCFELADRDVKVTAAGFLVTLRTPTLQGIAVYQETVPHNEATPSPDGRYWRCQWGGKRKCFFAPTGSM